MKLIDILVRDLPKLGGWPDGIDDIEMLSDGTIYFNGDIAPDNYKLTQCSDGWSRLKSVKDYSNAVTREQYEDELAVSKAAWDGDGLPGVGIKCEHCPGGTTQHEWEVVTVAGIYENLVTGFTDFWLIKENGSSYTVGNPYRFRPIRSEADKKRDAFVDQVMQWMHHAGRAEIELIYDKISAGELPLPHIRID